MRHDSTRFLTAYLYQPCEQPLHQGRLWTLCFLLLSSLCLANCATTSTHPAPVIERVKQSSQASKDAVALKNSASGATQNKKNLSADQYEVVKGDTLYSIGKKLGIPYQKIAESNNIGNNTIYFGQILTISADIAANSQNDSSNVVIQPLKSTDVPTATEVKPVMADGMPHDGQAKSTQSVAGEDAKPSDTTSKESSAIDLEAIQDQQIEWRWPAKGKLIADYNKEMNKGIDIAGNVGQAIFAAAAGKVIYSGLDIRGYGKLVIIKHNRNLLSVYAHQGNLLVKEGQFVSANQKIAEMGRDNTVNTKLHFEIRKNGKTVDPKEYLPTS